MEAKTLTSNVGGFVSRGWFLKSGLSFASALVVSDLLPGAVQAQSPDNSVPVWMKSLGAHDVPYGAPALSESPVQRRSKEKDPRTAGMDVWHSPIQYQRGIITPSGLHFSVNHNGIPDIDPQKHRLILHGFVDHPIEFDVERLMRYPMVSRIQFLECAGNSGFNAGSPYAQDLDAQDLFGQASCSEWTGVPLSVLLNEAGVQPKAKWAIVEGADGGSHSRSLPLSKLMDDCLIALYQNGERIRPSQGYPMRLWVPGWEGNVNVKWVHRIELTDTPAYTKDESGLYSDISCDGALLRFTFPMDVKSVITHPSGKQQLPEKGYYELSGLAWSGYGSIKQVELSDDGGRNWHLAELQNPALDRAFTAFTLPWKWNGKKHILMSRATDSRGRVQPKRKEWKKNYASYSFNHYNAIQAWRVNSDGTVENTYA